MSNEQKPMHPGGPEFYQALGDFVASETSSAAVLMVYLNSKYEVGLTFSAPNQPLISRT